jgi:hypothetical protein
MMMYSTAKLVRFSDIKSSVLNDFSKEAEEATQTSRYTGRRYSHTMKEKISHPK